LTTPDAPEKSAGRSRVIPLTELADGTDGELDDDHRDDDPAPGRERGVVAASAEAHAMARNVAGSTWIR
jgi:hypothetical protein